MSFLEYRAQKGQAGRAQISYTAVWLGTNGTGEKVFHLYDKTEYRDPPMSMIMPTRHIMRRFPRDDHSPVTGR